MKKLRLSLNTIKNLTPDESQMVNGGQTEPYTWGGACYSKLCYTASPTCNTKCILK